MQVSKQVRADTDAVFSSRWWQSSLNIYKIATPDRPPLAAVMLFWETGICFFEQLAAAGILVPLPGALLLPKDVSFTCKRR